MSIPIPGTVPIACGGFGKLPSQADFVRFSANSKEVRALERWVQQGLLYSRHALMAEWNLAFDTRLAYRFIFRPDLQDSAIAGVIRAQVDLYGRRFPFVAFSILPPNLPLSEPSFLCAIQEGLFNELEQRMDDGVQVSNVDEIQAVFTEAASLDADFESEDARYNNFLEELECADLGAPPGIAGEKMLGEWIAAVTALQAMGRRASIHMEWPLLPSEHVRSLELRFWLELCSLLLEPSTLCPSLFWGSSAGEADSPRLLMAVRQPLGALFGALLSESGGGASAWQVGQLVSHGILEESALPRVKPNATLRSILEALKSVYPRPHTIRQERF